MKSSGQTAKERREIRTLYRSLGQKTGANKAVLADITTSGIANILKEADKLNSRVEKPREHAADAELLCQVTEVTLDQARRQMRGRQGRTAAEFLARLRAQYVRTGNPQEDGVSNPAAFAWALLGAATACYVKACPGVACMLGPMDQQPKVRRAAVKAERRPVGAAVAPTQLQQIGDTDKQETDRNMEEMYEVVMRVRQAPFAELVCNSHSFGQTIENIFTLAFLVRDQKVRLVGDPEQGLQVVALSNDQAAAASRKKPEEAVQFVYTFTQDRWETMRRVVGGQHNCLMRHRVASAASQDTLPAAGPGSTEVGSIDQSTGRKRGSAALSDSTALHDLTNQQLVQATNKNGKRTRRV